MVRPGMRGCLSRTLSRCAQGRLADHARRCLCSAWRTHGRRDGGGGAGSEPKGRGQRFVEALRMPRSRRGSIGWRRPVSLTGTSIRRCSAAPIWCSLSASRRPSAPSRESSRPVLAVPRRPARPGAPERASIPAQISARWCSISRSSVFAPRRAVLPRRNASACCSDRTAPHKCRASSLRPARPIADGRP